MNTLGGSTTVDSGQSSNPLGSQTSLGVDKVEDLEVMDGCLSVYVYRRSDQSAADVLRAIFT